MMKRFVIPSLAALGCLACGTIEPKEDRKTEQSNLDEKKPYAVTSLSDLAAAANKESGSPSEGKNTQKVALSKDQQFIGDILWSLNEIVISELEECRGDKEPLTGEKLEKSTETIGGKEESGDSSDICKNQSIDSEATVLFDRISTVCFRQEVQLSEKSRKSCPKKQSKIEGCEYDYVYTLNLGAKSCKQALLKAQQLFEKVKK